MNAAIGVNPWIMAGNWTRANGSYVRGGCILNMVAHDEREQDATFITAAHTAFPALLAAAERLARYEAALYDAEQTLAFYADKAAWNQPPVRTVQGLLSVEYENQASLMQRDRGAKATAALAALARIVEGGE